MFDASNVGGNTAAPIKATPWVYRDPKTIPPRQWLYDRHFIRGFMACTISPGGIGKSSLLLVEAIAMASGRNLLSVGPVKPLQVWYWNGEDPIEEIERRVAAIMAFYRIDPNEIAGRLFIDTGRKQKIIIASKTRNGVDIAHPLVKALKETIKANKIDVLIIDPFVRCHEVTENDNSEIELVADQWSSIADAGNCAVELVHHSRKSGGAEITVEHGRGAVCLIDRSRSARVLNQMTLEEAAAAGITHSPRFYFRVDNGKANLAPPSDNTKWFRLNSFNIGNGDDGDYPLGDDLQVVATFKMPRAMDAVTPVHLLEVQRRLAADGQWRAAVQAKDRWVGILVAEVLGIDLAIEPKTLKGQRAQINTILASWLKSGAIREVERKDGNGDDRKFIEVGTLAN